MTCFIKKGNYKQSAESIKTKRLALPPDTQVYGGYRVSTNVGFEQQDKLFLEVIGSKIAPRGNNVEVAGLKLEVIGSKIAPKGSNVEVAGFAERWCINNKKILLLG
ncbi:hypothetical protein OKE68_09380 [Riemerella anatipestifer]|uniref:Uncharacterized protein n=1 Tax=Riemerella anatipestifer TaxID=34085 RepID=A0AAP3AMM3_RIEAN|nr:hypothetical protein [Riemerella anatipestifer]MBT0572343.1 hypothetical protein [Riemerella anatipestifer]MCW0490981.1 hypothetical protein [Riemerella anatipestifer]MCW0524525.1 hypothetical protein [Riemerella anatipestifer]MDR7797500.1 hypothetical protein [Riemerella anatipestifer]MDY3433899.1 hypothetical protein [Riemerella anatipestifer]